MKVCKFGGTSMANGKTIKQVAKILNSEDDRRFTVVSAPGKRDKADVKVTDILLAVMTKLCKTAVVTAHLR